MAQRIQVRRDTAANWTSTNPVLAAGEHGYETDTDQFKIGDGVTAWNSIATYFTKGGGGGGVTDHGALTGLADDDHGQYHNDARGDARYYVQATVDSKDTAAQSAAEATAAAALSGHTGAASGAHAASAISNTPSGNLAASTVQAALDELQGDIDGLSSGTVPDDSVTNAKLANVATDTIKGRTTAGTGDPEDLSAAQVRAILNVEDGATADQTGAEIKAAYEAEADTNAFTDADHTKLDGIEANATADQTAADIRALGFFDTSNDGTGSGLDADTVDGNEATALLARANHTGTQAHTTISDFDAGVQTNRLDQMAAPTADVDINDNALDDVVTPVLTEAGTAWTLALEDRNGIVRSTAVTAKTVTVPANATVAFPTGSTVTVRNVGANNLTVAGAGGVTVNGNKTISQGETILLHKVATNEWDAHGGTAA